MRMLFFIAIIAGVFWWFAPQTTRDKTADFARAGASRGIELAAQYREPVLDWVKDVAGAARDKTAAIFRAQMHRAVDENVQ